MNKTLTSWLSVVVVFLCLPLLAWNGSGTYEDPYEINTASDVADLVQAVNGGASQSGVYFLQTADIDLSSFGNFTPIGLPTAPFSGAYDGDGYILSNLTITASASGAVTNAFGLFGYCDNATVENVSVYGKVNVSADYNAGACVGVGGVIGVSNNGYFTSLRNYCDISLTLANAVNASENAGIKYGAAGIIGVLRSPTSYTYYSCENYGEVVFYGLNGESCVSGCANYRARVGSSTGTFSGFNNFGKISATEVVHSTQEYNDAFCAGIVSTHFTLYGGGYRPSIASGCANFGTITATGSVCVAGIQICSGQAGSESSACVNSTNYGNIRGVHSDNNPALYSGCHVSMSTYIDGETHGCCNYGGITITGNATSYVRVGGVRAGRIEARADDTGRTLFNLYNFGRISVNTPNATAYVGGVLFKENQYSARSCINYGDIDVIANNAYVGGVASRSSYNSHPDVFRALCNFGQISVSANGGSVGGVYSGIHAPSTSTRSVAITNCYAIGRIVSNVANTGSLVGMLVGIANYTIDLGKCYASSGYPLVGYVDATSGSVSIHDCFNIGGLIVSSLTGGNFSTNNIASLDYDNVYHDTASLSGFLYDYAFTAADKTTNYFDLILPINKTLFPVQTDEIISLHNWTKANDFKRYTRTIQQ